MVQVRLKLVTKSTSSSNYNDVFPFFISRAPLLPGRLEPSIASYLVRFGHTRSRGRRRRLLRIVRRSVRARRVDVEHMDQVRLVISNIGIRTARAHAAQGHSARQRQHLKRRAFEREQLHACRLRDEQHTVHEREAAWELEASRRRAESTEGSHAAA